VRSLFHLVIFIIAAVMFLFAMSSIAILWIFAVTGLLMAFIGKEKAERFGPPIAVWSFLIWGSIHLGWPLGIGCIVIGIFTTLVAEGPSWC
jgi:hypothetical protein